MPMEFKEDKEPVSGLWRMYFDGSRIRNGVGVGVVFFSPKEEKFFFTHILQFTFSNNVAEYEALVHGLLIAEKRKIKKLQIFGDNELVINQ
ncbi:hypothetical protein KI387_032942, partial [Taxus chinensis]